MSKKSKSCKKESKGNKGNDVNPSFSDNTIIIRCPYKDDPEEGIELGFSGSSSKSNDDIKNAMLSALTLYQKSRIDRDKIEITINGVVRPDPSTDDDSDSVDKDDDSKEDDSVNTDMDLLLQQYNSAISHFCKGIDKTLNGFKVHLKEIKERVNTLFNNECHNDIDDDIFEDDMITQSLNNLNNTVDSESERFMITDCLSIIHRFLLNEKRNIHDISIADLTDVYIKHRTYCIEDEVLMTPISNNVIKEIKEIAKARNYNEDNLNEIIDLMSDEDTSLYESYPIFESVKGRVDYPYYVDDKGLLRFMHTDNSDHYVFIDEEIEESRYVHPDHIAFVYDNNYHESLLEDKIIINYHLTPHNLNDINECYCQRLNKRIH